MGRWIVVFWVLASGCKVGQRIDECGCDSDEVCLTSRLKKVKQHGECVPIPEPCPASGDWCDDLSDDCMAELCGDPDEVAAQWCKPDGEGGGLQVAACYNDERR